MKCIDGALLARRSTVGRHPERRTVDSFHTAAATLPPYRPLPPFPTDPLCQMATARPGNTLWTFIHILSPENASSPMIRKYDYHLYGRAVGRRIGGRGWPGLRSSLMTDVCHFWLPIVLPGPLLTWVCHATFKKNEAQILLKLSGGGG